MTENDCDGKAAWALDIHEIRVGALYKTLLLVLPLLIDWAGVKKISFNERHY